MDRRVGLCASCRHARAVRSERRAQFWLCERAQHDARFVKYPRLPVIACSGYAVSDQGTSA